MHRTEVLWNKIEETVGKCFLSWKPNKISKYLHNLKWRKKIFCPDFAFEVSMLLFHFIWRQLKFVRYLTVVVDQDVSPVRSSLIYLVKRFNIYTYIMFVQSKKYGRWWFFDCSCICSHRLHGIKAIHESPLIENVRLKPMFISDQTNFWLGYFNYILCN